MDNIISSNERSAQNSADDHEDRIQSSWWQEQRLSSTPPSAVEFLVHLGLDEKCTKKFLLDHIKEVVENEEGKFQDGYLEKAVEICSDVLEDLDSDQAVDLMLAAMDPQKNHSKNDILALVRALPKFVKIVQDKHWDQVEAVVDYVKAVAENHEEPGALEKAVEIRFDVLQYAFLATEGSRRLETELLAAAMHPDNNNSENGILALVRACETPRDNLEVTWPEDIWGQCLVSAHLSPDFVGKFLDIMTVMEPDVYIQIPAWSTTRHHEYENDEGDLVECRYCNETDDNVNDKLRLSISKAGEARLQSNEYYEYGLVLSKDFFIDMLSCILRPDSSNVKTLLLQLPVKVCVADPSSALVSVEDICNALHAAIPGNVSHSKIQEVSVWLGSYEEQTPYSGLLGPLVAKWMPNLKKLDLGGEGIVNFSKETVEAILSNKTLEALTLGLSSSVSDYILETLEEMGPSSLSLKSLKLNHKYRGKSKQGIVRFAKQLKRVLENNTVLEELASTVTHRDVNHRTTRVSVFDVEEENERGQMVHHGSILRLYLALNRCGRGKILQEGSTVETLVNCLVKAHSDDWISGKDDKHYNRRRLQSVSEEEMECRKISIIFGLVSLKPSLLGHVKTGWQAMDAAMARFIERITLGGTFVSQEGYRSEKP